MTDGVGAGSLTGLLFAIHLNGFRLFMKSAECEAFRRAKHFADTSFAASFQKQTTLDLPRFTPSTIFQRLSKEVRARGAKDNRFVAEVIAREYFRDFTGKTALPDADDDSPEVAFLTRLGAALARSFESWNDLKTKTLEACEVIEQFLRQDEDLELPSIASMVRAGAASSASKPKRLNKQTIIFDQAAAAPNFDTDGIEPYVVTAIRLKDVHCMGIEKRAEVRKKTQQLITTDNNAGLSWLFSVGLDALKTLDEDALSQGLGVPQAERGKLRAVIESAKAIPAPDVFQGLRYAKFRMTVGGRLDSWLANYVSRLYELSDLLGTMTVDFDLPDALGKPEASPLFSGMGVSFDELSNMLRLLESRRDSAHHALQRLMGKANDLPQRSDIEAIELFSGILSSVEGHLAMLTNRVKQELDSDETSHKDLASSCKYETPPWLKELPAVNQFRGGGGPRF